MKTDLKFHASSYKKQKRGAKLTYAEGFATVDTSCERCNFTQGIHICITQ